MMTRRDFLDTVALTSAGVALGSTAKSYAQIVGANDRLNFAVFGLNGRGGAHLSSLKANAKTARMSHVCDVESNTMKKYCDSAKRELGYAPATEKDFRKVLSIKEVDAVTIATPDHWHSPMAIAALEAGKHVYVEKPCSHNPAEGAMLVQAQAKYGKVVQMGSQQRSSPHSIEIIDKIHNGVIGRAYMAKAWYANNRGSIGVGKEVPVPETLDWDLFQGPAPRQPYRDNVQPYNWHWFKVWGTGESLNNGTHEVDVCRWALGVDYPNRVTASAGRFHYKDDWQFYDTMVTSFEYEDKMISWDGNCCNKMKYWNRDRGSVILGTTGSVLVDRAGYEVYDLKGTKTAEVKAKTESSSNSSDTIGADSMTDAHFANFISAIKTGEKLRAPIANGNISVTMMQLSNIAWETKRELQINPADGKVVNDPAAMKFWGREYEKDWAPHL